MNKLNIIGARKWYYLISTLMLLPGLIVLMLSGLKLGIDFTGGSLLELQFEQQVEAEPIKEVLSTLGLGDSTVQTSQDNTALIRTKTLEVQQIQQPVTEEQNEIVTNDEALPPETTETPEEVITDSTESAVVSTESEQTVEVPSEPAPSETIELDEKQRLLVALREQVGPFEEKSFESVGPVIGAELTRKALYSVLVASLMIILYIAWAFRSVPKPASSLRFGICAIAALLHDVLFLLGAFAILGRWFGVEVNAMFVVAVLTVMGFSVHDSIVVFDRIRETLKREHHLGFEPIVNRSILETLGRSINTTLTVILTLLALFLFGGESIRIFTLALLLGILSGAYSSIFNAAPLLVDWQNLADRRKQRTLRA